MTRERKDSKYLYFMQYFICTITYILRIVLRIVSHSQIIYLVDHTSIEVRLNKKYGSEIQVQKDDVNESVSNER